jgi:hypothetical protein
MAVSREGYFIRPVQFNVENRPVTEKGFIWIISVSLFYRISTLKVPKREIFVTELFTLSDPIWIGDMRIEPKNYLCKVLGRYSPFCFFTDD